MFFISLSIFPILTNYFELDLNTSKVPKCLITFQPNWIEQYSISSYLMFSEYRIQKRLFGNRRERRRAMGELFHCHKTMSSIIVSLAPDRHREASSSSLKKHPNCDPRGVYFKDIMVILSL